MYEAFMVQNDDKRKKVGKNDDINGKQPFLSLRLKK